MFNRPFQVSQTEEGKGDQDGKKFIVVSYMTGVRDRRSRDTNSWPRSRGKFLHFALHKIDGDSTVIFAQLRRNIFSQNSKANCKFKIAGLKDR